MSKNIISQEYSQLLTDLKLRVASARYKAMRKFSEEYPDFEFVQEVLAQLTWYHNMTLLGKVSDKQIRLFYVKTKIIFLQNIHCEI